METHVKILAWFNVVLGALGIIIGVAVFGGSMVIADLIGAAVQGAGVPTAVLHLFALIVTIVVLAVSLPCLIGGFGLLNLRPWGRILGLILAAVNLLNVPVGTAVSLYAFWVLLKPETEALFRTRPNDQPPPSAAGA